MAAPTISNFVATPSTITVGQSSVLSATVSGSGRITLTLNGAKIKSLPVTVKPSAPTIYTLKATNNLGSATASLTVYVNPVQYPPVINYFTATPATITAGQSSVLSATVTGATSMTLDGVSVTLPVTVTPTQTHTYTLVATNGAGSVSATTTVTVNAVVVTGTQYYVDAVSGNDANNGTSPSTAWKTLAKVYGARLTFQPGDSVALNRGQTWNEQYTIANVHGTAANPITFGAYGTGNAPIISGQGTGNAIVIGDVTYVTINDLHCTQAVADGFNVVCASGAVTNLTVNRVLSDSNGRDGFEISGEVSGPQPDAVYLQSCVANLNERAGFLAFNVAGGSGTTGIWHYNCQSTYSGQGEAAHGFSSYQSGNIHWVMCEAALTNIDPATGLPNAFTTEGHGFANDDLSTGNSCEFCYTHNNQGVGIAAGHMGSNNTIHANVVQSNGNIGIVVNGDVGNSNNILILDNTIASNTGSGIEIWGPADIPAIKNNLITNNGGWGIKFTGTVTNAVVATNLIYNNTSGATSGVTGATGTITSNPLLNTNLTLQLGSPAINSGLNLGLTYQYALSPLSSWPAAVATLNQNSFGSGWEIGSFVFTP